MQLPDILRLEPQRHTRVWGGQRLAAASPPIGELWVVHEDCRLAAGPQAGTSLAALAAEFGPTLIGTAAQSGQPFPLLVKLLDIADWLSLQVHPNDEQALRLEGKGQLGKTEAWHIVEATPGAELICGLRPGVTPDTLATAISGGTILELVERHAVQAGDTVFVPAGTIHALGPGLLVYEVQQSSDITYRVFDWHRPPTAGRQLHIAQTLAVADPRAQGQLRPRPPLVAGRPALLAACAYFRLEMIVPTAEPMTLDTAGASFHALTVIEGTVELATGGAYQRLEWLESAVVPAAVGAYRLSASAPGRVLKASVV